MLSGAASAGAPPEQGDTARLIVRARAGLPHGKQQRLLAQHEARRRGHLKRLDAAIVEVPRAKLAGVKAALRRSGAFSTVEEDARVSTTTAPSDPLFALQWGVVQISALESWAISRGAATIPIAVVDTGVDASHPDLAGQILPGYDFANGDADPSDDNGHGTAMTGIIVAKADNAIGVAGIAPEARVLPVKVLDADGTGYYSAVAEGIIYAVDQGAKVINLSLAGADASTTLQSAVDYARAHGAIVVAAAGNYGTGVPMYPAACNGAVAITASDARDQRATFSNYGAWTSLAAPGVGIFTTAPGGSYAGVTGTSPATAVASGAFALLLAANPDMTGADAVARATAKTLDIGTSGWDPYSGFGRVDAYAALVSGEAMRRAPDRTAPTVSLVNPSKDSLVYGIVPVDVAASDNLAVVRVDLEIDRQLYATATTPPFAFAWDTTGLPAGSHKLKATAYDAAGNHASTLEMRLDVTPGVGLLVKRSAVMFGRLPQSDSFSAAAVFSLPDGMIFDSYSDTVTVELSSAEGEVFALTVPPTALIHERTGAVRFTGASTLPSIGTASIRITKNRTGNAYALLLYSRKLNLANIGTTTNLRLMVGSSVLTQAVLFRDSRGRLVVP